MNIGSTSTLYHKPIFTIALMLICLAVTFVSMISGPETMYPYQLSHGRGMNPVQWFISPFIHGDMIQMAGNLIFLGLFGVFIEGKVGTPIFAILFLGTAISANAIEQGVMLGVQSQLEEEIPTVNMIGRTTPLTAEEKAILSRADELRREKLESNEWNVTPGASSTILGLMAICILWGPLSFYIFGQSSDGVEIPMLVAVGGFVVWTIAKCALGGFQGGGSPAQLIGLAPGIFFGTTLLMAGLARTGGTNLLGVADSGGDEQAATITNEDGTVTTVESRDERKKREASKTRDRKEAAKEKEALLREAAVLAPKRNSSNVKLNRAIQETIELIDNGNADDAVQSLLTVSDPRALAQFPIEKYSTLYQSMAKDKNWPVAVEVLEKSIEGHPDDCVEQRLQLSRLLLAMKQTERCHSILGKIPRKELTPEQAKLYKQLVIQIRQAD